MLADIDNSEYLPQAISSEYTTVGSSIANAFVICFNINKEECQNLP
jgi:hypothetical protein